MTLNLSFIKYKDYQVDFKYLQTCFNHLSEIQDFSIKNNLPFKVIGHISLILLSNKVYRNPDDIDIQVNKNDFKKWFVFFQKEWNLWGGPETYNKLKLILEDKAIKYASIDINNCSEIENKADLYKINNKTLSLDYCAVDNNVIENHIDDPWDPFPKFVIHNPSQKKHDGKPFIEIKNNKFKIWFYSNRVGQNSKSFIIFYDAKLKHKELVECTWQYDYDFNNKVSAYWSSPELDIEKFETSYYRIFIYKNCLGLTFKNKISDIKLETYLMSHTLEKYRPIPTTYQSSIITLNSYNELLLNNKIIRVGTLKEIFLSKFNRSKDLDDYEIYKYLFDKYP